jgi:hypothetical protein
MLKAQTRWAKVKLSLCLTKHDAKKAKLTNSTVQSPSWEAESQETTRYLYNQNVHYRVHKSQPPAPILSQMNPVHPNLPTVCPLRSHLRPGLPRGLFPTGFPTKILCAFLRRRILCLIEHNAAGTYGGVNVYLHAFLTSAPDGGEWSALHLGERGPSTHWMSSTKCHTSGGNSTPVV